MRILKPEEGRVGKRIKFLGLIVITGFFLSASATAWALQGPEQGSGNYSEEPDTQDDLINAQTTLSSLFGKNAVMAVPPQIAGGTVALPSFDSGNLLISEEVVEEDEGAASKV